MTTYDVCGKVVLITGAGSGIGAALAALMHRRGASVVLLDIDADAVKHAEAEFGERALAVVADVTDRAAMAAAVDTTVEYFGRVDVVVANAGISGGPATVQTVVPAEFDRVIDVNVRGVFNTVHPALDEVVRNGGHVVIIASAAAFVPGPGLAPYTMSKAAVEQLGRALRIELAGHGASAGAVYFGFVKTQMLRPVDEDPVARQLARILPWPLNQRLTPEAAAEAIGNNIAHRAGSTVAPAGWLPYAFARGAANAVFDNRAAASRTVRRAIRALEQRVAGQS